jgi:caa(3)-type oxidase subunit IV
MSEHRDMKRAYLAVFGVLTVGTILTMAAAGITFQNVLINILVAVAIAAFKATCVMAIFMHLKYDDRVLRDGVFFPLALLVVFVLGNVADTSLAMRHPPFPAVDKVKEAEHKAHEGAPKDGETKPTPPDEFD